jgi:hypothetical protein
MSSVKTVFEPESAAAVPPSDTNRATRAMTIAGDGRSLECIWNLPMSSRGGGQARRRVHQGLSANPATAGTGRVSLRAGQVNLEARIR